MDNLFLVTIKKGSTIAKSFLLDDFTNMKQGSICETRAVPNRPELEGVWFFVDFKYIFYENRYFSPIWQLQVGHPKPIGPQPFGFGPKKIIWSISIKITQNLNDPIV